MRNGELKNVCVYDMLSKASIPIPWSDLYQVLVSMRLQYSIISAPIDVYIYSFS